MQRSRKALLKRRDNNSDKNKINEKKYLYKVSLSVVFLLWIHVFLLNSLKSHGNGSKDEQQEPIIEPISQENYNYIDNLSNYENTPTLEREHYENAPTGEGEIYQNTPHHETLLPKNDYVIAEPIAQAEKVERENNEERESKEERENKQERETKQEVERENKDDTETKQEVERENKDDIETKQEVERESKEERENKERETKQEVERESKEERESTVQKPDRISRIAPLPLDEFKNKAIISKGKTVNSQTGPITHRLEPGGKEYNYASLSKGAKILSFNKEAKGANNILDKDKDKYLRNPCSAEGKFVILELSEETLVSTIRVANYEHYSANLKDFEVFSSLVYPTEIWDKIGGFSANNSKHAQRFELVEPKWARYLKFNFLSHFGSEFYCTLSCIEVFGVDAVEKMLENLILDEKEKNKISEDQIENMPNFNPPVVTPQETIENEDLKLKENNEDILDEFEINFQENENKKVVPVPVVPVQESVQVGRIQGDTALKVLLQKVQGLDLNFSVLERYLEELNNRYGEIFKDFDDDMANKDLLIEKLISRINDLEKNKEIMVNEIREIKDWKLLVSAQIDKLVSDNQILRFEVEKGEDRYNKMENKGLAVVFVSFIFGSLAISKLFLGALLRIFGFLCSEKVCRISSGWVLLLLSCSIISFIIVI